MRRSIIPFLRSCADYLLAEYGYGISLSYPQWVAYLQLEDDHWWETEFRYGIYDATWRRPLR